VTTEEKNNIVETYDESITTLLQEPDYPDWKQKKFPMFPLTPETFKGPLYADYMNRSIFKICANRGKIRCALFDKPCNIMTGSRSKLKGYIIITNVSSNDFFVDKYTELGTLIFGYDGFTQLCTTFYMDQYNYC
jgi:hypothetical protein